MFELYFRKKNLWFSRKIKKTENIDLWPWITFLAHMGSMGTFGILFLVVYPWSPQIFSCRNFCYLVNIFMSILTGLTKKEIVAWGLFPVGLPINIFKARLLFPILACPLSWLCEIINPVPWSRVTCLNKYAFYNGRFLASFKTPKLWPWKIVCGCLFNHTINFNPLVDTILH